MRAMAETAEVFSCVTDCERERRKPFASDRKSARFFLPTLFPGLEQDNGFVLLAVLAWVPVKGATTSRRNALPLTGSPGPALIIGIGRGKRGRRQGVSS